MEFDGIKDVESNQTPSLLGMPREKTLSKMGPLFVASNITRWIAPANIVISDIRYRVAVASSGAAINFTLKKNGVSILDAVLGEGQYAKVDTPSDVNGLEGDEYSVDLTQVGLITAGAHLQIQIMYKTVE